MPGNRQDRLGGLNKEEVFQLVKTLVNRTMGIHGHPPDREAGEELLALVEEAERLTDPRMAEAFTQKGSDDILFWAAEEGHVNLVKIVLNAGVSPTLTFTPGERTKILLNYEHLHDRRVADRGIPSYQGRPADTLGVGGNLGVAEAKHLQAMSPQVGLPARVILAASGVSTAVEFHRHGGFKAEEVDDEGVDLNVDLGVRQLVAAA